MSSILSKVDDYNEKDHNSFKKIFDFYSFENFEYSNQCFKIIFSGFCGYIKV